MPGKRASISIASIVGLAVGSAALPVSGLRAEPHGQLVTDSQFDSAQISSAPCMLPASAPSVEFPVSVPASSTKASSLLGGQKSSLEAMREKQNGSMSALAAAHRPAVSTSDAGQTLVPFKHSSSGGCALSGSDAKTVAETPAIFSGERAAPSPAQARADVFLRAPRVSIGKTTLDGQWAKVADRGLSRGVVRAAIPGSGKLDREALVDRVNQWANHTIAYKDDQQSFHRPDVWSDARSTLSRGAGDCEDIAILKYQALAALGVPRQDMYVTIARDTIRRADHALLVVRLGERFVVLDSATDKLLDGASDNGYRALLSFNSDGKWLHGELRQAPSPDPAATLAYLSRNAVSSARFIGLRR